MSAEIPPQTERPVSLRPSNVYCPVEAIHVGKEGKGRGPWNITLRVDNTKGRLKCSGAFLVTADSHAVAVPAHRGVLQLRQVSYLCGLRQDTRAKIFAAMSAYTHDLFEVKGEIQLLVNEDGKSRSNPPAQLIDSEPSKLAFIASYRPWCPRPSLSPAARERREKAMAQVIAIHGPQILFQQQSLEQELRSTLSSPRSNKGREGRDD